jgi:serum/glucocorticoid-regulated kinase 2
MSSWLGRSKKPSTTNLRPESPLARSTTPTPGYPEGKPSPPARSGLLAIRVLWAEGLGLPAGTSVPPAVQSALTSQQAKIAASVSPSSVTQQRLAKTKGSR